MNKIDLFDNYNYRYYGRNIHKLFDFRKTLISRTIFWSIITAIIIIVCLSVIPFGDIILDNVTVTYLLFNSVIIGLIFIFYNLLSILIDSLKDPDLE